MAQPGCYDIVAQAVSGLMSLTGLPELPIRTGPAIADAISGLTAAVGLLSALYRRERTGQGGYVDVAMADAVFATLEHSLAAYSVTGEVPQRAGNIDYAIAPFDCFESSDGWVVIAAGNDRIWQRLVALVGPQLDQPVFATNAARVQHYDCLRPLLATWCAGFSSNSMLARLHAANIPAGAVRNLDDLAVDARLEARDMLLKLELDSGEQLLVPGSPIHLSGTERPLAQRAPRLGEHTTMILAQAGLAQD
jgi:CoA:oxalate CoA-transferase